MALRPSHTWVLYRVKVAFSRRVLRTGRQNHCYFLGRLLPNKAYCQAALRTRREYAIVCLGPVSTRAFSGAESGKPRGFHRHWTLSLLVNRAKAFLDVHCQVCEGLYADNHDVKFIYHEAKFSDVREMYLLCFKGKRFSNMPRYTKRSSGNWARRNLMASGNCRHLPQ
jgi:hypothetical protein